MPALSPKTQDMMQLPSADQEQNIFEQSFSDMAQSMLMNKLPQLAQDIATFKIIDSDIDSGSAVGAFILQRPSGMLYVPVVLAENQLKPLEIIYSQEHDVFVPLNPEWLEEIERGSINPLGDATKTPQTLYTDVDIRNLVVPPTTGRYSYASANDLKLPDFLANAENSVKRKFAHVLEADRELLKTAVAIYGSKTLMEAMRPTAEKTAAEEGPKTSTESLSVVTRDSSAKDFKDIFGDEAPAAMRGVAVKGYYSKDTRKNLNRPIDTDAPVKLEEIRSTGAFKLVKKDGSAVTAMVFHRPTVLHHANHWDSHKKDMKYDRFAGPKKHTDNIENQHSNSEYLVIASDGTACLLHCPILGTPLSIGELSGKASTAATGGDASMKAGKGVFVRNRGGTIEATEPVEISNVSTGSDGVKRAKAKVGMFGMDEITLVMDPTSAYGRILAPSKDNVVSIPKDFKWMAVSIDPQDRDNCPFVKDPLRLTSVYLSKLTEDGAKPVTVKKASDDDYSIGGTGFNGTRVGTTLKLASEYRISVPDAETIVKLADERRFVRVMVASPAALQKLAADDSKKEKKPDSPKKKTTVTEEPAADPNSQPPGDPSMDPGMDPAMAGGDPGMDPAMAGGDPGMDPAMTGGMPPMAPSPTDQAVAELQEEVQRAHEEQMKLLQHKLDALQMVAQRTQEITQGVPKDQSQAIQQAVSTAAQGAAQAGAPAPAGVPGATPPPATPGVGAAPMDGPAAAGPGMDPNAPVDPAMMQQASGMADPEMFDSAAIGSLAEHSSLKDLITNYLPTLEKSVDHTGRILLTVWMKGNALRKEMGEQNYSSLEDRLRTMFRGMGDIVLRLNKDSLILNEEDQDLSDNDAA